MNSPVKYLKDYHAPDFWVDEISLDIDIHDDETLVSSRLVVRRRQSGDTSPLRLDGGELETLWVRLDGVELSASNYALTSESLLLPVSGDAAVVEIGVRIHPETNTSLEGLYRSGPIYCTQCEAEGFRKITWYPDRPDVLSRFRTTLRADQRRYPVLLCNGNRMAAGTLENGRHYVTYDDPTLKPCYLFAAVAGDLEVLEDEFVTLSGRRVALQIYAEAADRPKCHHAMDSLKRAMHWDEQVYGREYDLDVYMIVAVSYFNMGAMENKGLNIFNTSCVLASQGSTTDAGFQRVESVVAHEYFHNWSGNRVTCRDWFQLCLKEGFTVFRDQQFSGDMLSHAVQRIDDLVMLRTYQFAEDASPLSHAVRPESFVEINNFYTATVYEKGAELVRMLALRLGQEGFRRGTDLYFSRHDGQAVTVEDFLRALGDASGEDLNDFLAWYRRPGTPKLKATTEFDAIAGRYRLHLQQLTEPLPVPVRISLLGQDGKEIEWEVMGAMRRGDCVWLTEKEATVVASGHCVEPVPVLLKGFSAPVRLDYPYAAEDLAHIVRFEQDGVSRWLAMQELWQRVIVENAQKWRQGEGMGLPLVLPQTLASITATVEADAALAARLLTMPSEVALAEAVESYDPEALHMACRFVRQAVGKALLRQWRALAQLSVAENYHYDASSIGRRAIRHLSMSYWSAADGDGAALQIVEQFYAADNMTDRMAALSLLVRQGGIGAAQALAELRGKHSAEALVMDQWFSIQASSPHADAGFVTHVLLADKDFDWMNPNRVRAVIGAFSQQNPAGFHEKGGAGYRLLCTAVKRLDGTNPQLAARLLGAFSKAGRLLPELRAEVLKALNHLAASRVKSTDVQEMLTRLISGLD